MLESARKVEVVKRGRTSTGATEKQAVECDPSEPVPFAEPTMFWVDDVQLRKYLGFELERLRNRTRSAPLTDLGFYMLRESDHRIETLGVYQSKTDDGKLLQCNAANLRHAHGGIEAILCINIDVTRETEKHSHNGTTTTPAEHYQTSVDQVVERMISDARRAVNGALTRDLKFELVRALDARGVFLARGAVRQVASALEIAAPTIYKYIQLARRHRGTTKKPAGPEQRPKRVRPRADA